MDAHFPRVPSINKAIVLECKNRPENRMPIKLFQIRTVVANRYGQAISGYYPDTGAGEAGKNNQGVLNTLTKFCSIRKLNTYVQNSNWRLRWKKTGTGT